MSACATSDFGHVRGRIREKALAYACVHVVPAKANTGCAHAKTAIGSAWHTCSVSRTHGKASSHPIEE